MNQISNAQIERPKKTLRSAKNLSLGLIICSLVLGLLACTKKTDTGSANSDIVVGEFGSLSGTEATFGISTSEGIQLAFEEQNQKGGVKGRKLKLISLDNQGKAEEARAVVQRLITQEKVIAVLGEVASTRTLAAAPVAQQYKIPLITPSSTNVDVTKVGDHIFRICFTDQFQGQVMARFAKDELKLTKVAVLSDVKSDYSTGLSDVFKREFRALGGEIVGEESYQGGESDFKAQLTQLKSKAPEAIFVPGYYTEVGLIARQAKQLGLKVPLLGGDGWDSEKLSEIGQDAINGSYFANHYTTESSEPVVTEFIEKYKSKYKGKTPDGLAALGYDAAKILIAAMERTTELTPENIRNEIQATVDHVGVTGTISIDSNRNATKAAVVVKVDGKLNRLVSKMQP